jgi:DNA-binding NarL/FixJ family response regulator
VDIKINKKTIKNKVSKIVEKTRLYSNAKFLIIMQIPHK